MRLEIVLVFQGFLLVFPAHGFLGELSSSNDYDETLTCAFTPMSRVDCSELGLRVVFSPSRLYFGAFEVQYEGAEIKCQCNLHVREGFVSNEEFTAEILKGNKIESNSSFITLETIKPKTPTITSANQIKTNVDVTWKTKYTKEDYFESLLNTELNYRAVGANDWVSVNITESFKTNFEILGIKLKPNTDYAVRTRLLSKYNFAFSDWSDEKIFTYYPSSPDMRIIIPILCMIVVFTVCTLGFCCFKIKNKTWSKFSAPPKIVPFDNLHKILLLIPVKENLSIIVISDGKKRHPEVIRNHYCNQPTEASSSSTSILGSSPDYAQVGPSAEVDSGGQSRDSSLCSSEANTQRTKDSSRSSASSFENKAYPAPLSVHESFFIKDFQPIIPMGPTFQPPNTSSILAPMEDGYESFSKAVSQGDFRLNMVCTEPGLSVVDEYQAL
uniref:Fibronectin type-III domain-containing protein n=1 Tax=Denticeps clupeoides TaxID=299321 RepID=A0A8C4FVU3_9TELE